MSRSKQSKATITPATTSARKTQASPPTSKDPPIQGSRQLATSKAARSIRNNPATEQARIAAEELAFKADVQADALAVSTVADAKERIRGAKQAIKDLKNERVGQNTERNLEWARYELEVFRQRRDELKAAFPTASSANNNLSQASKGKGKGKGKTTAQSFSAMWSRRSGMSAPVAGSSVQNGSEDESQPPPLRRSPRHRDGQASQIATDDEDPTTADTEQSAKPKPAPKETKPWRHQPKKYWKMRGIIDENEKDETYLIVWDELYSDGTPWNDSWQKKYFANAVAKRDWEGRKGDPKLRANIDANTASVVENA